MASPSLNSIKKRILPMVIIVLLCMAALVVRLAYWQIIRGDELAARAKSQQTGSSTITASRGIIYDRNGKALAESVSADTLVCNPKDVAEDGDAQAAAEALAPILGMTAEEITEDLTRDSRYQVVKKRMSVDESQAVKQLLDTETNPNADVFKGLYFEDDSKRYYPFSIAPHILGFTGYDNNGLQGIELTFDDELSGKAGSIEQNQNASGTTLEEQQEEYLTAQQKGADVVLTIDETIQHFLEKHLEEAVEECKLKYGAAGIVMNPKTGEILAMATKPDFDSNNPYDIEAFNEYAMQYDYDEDEQETDDPEASPEPTEDPNNPSDERVAELRNRMWRNKAVSDSYEPGSTFKIITAAAALEEHVADLDSEFYCPGFKIVADRQIGCSNTDGHGPETFVEGVKNSCNPVFMDLGEALGADKFMEYFTAFGLTEKTGIELVGESSSIYYTDGMSEVDLATSSFGQGFQVTPIQLITAISAVINGGQRMKPQIVKEIRGESGIIKSYDSEVVNRVISEETSEKMRNILEQVVSDPNATGKNAYVKGCRIGGKTGTSEKNPRGSDKRIASFVGFAPANDPEIICLIMLDEPQTDNRYGGTIAAPLAGEIISDVLNYLGVEKQYSEEEEPIVKTEVPDVRETDLDAAETALEEAELDYVIRGGGSRIIDQLPAPGTMLNEDSLVILYTEGKSGGEEELVTVPDLSGMSVGVAESTLNSMYLNFEVMGAGHSESYAAFGVGQSVEPGEEVAPGTVIGVEFRQEAID